MIQGIHSFIISIVGFTFVIIIALIIGSGMVYINHQFAKQIACTEEARLCPDGSYVARQGPTCEFAPCPSEALCEGGKCPDVIIMGTIKGKVTVGPICPVEQEGVPCPVPKEAYTSREVILYRTDGVTIVKRMHFLADGTYSFEVSPGTYIIDTPKQGIGGSGDLPKTITIKSGETIEFNFSIDTGIR